MMLEYQKAYYKRSKRRVLKLNYTNYLTFNEIQFLLRNNCDGLYQKLLSNSVTPLVEGINLESSVGVLSSIDSIYMIFALDGSGKCSISPSIQELIPELSEYYTDFKLYNVNLGYVYESD